MSKCFIPLCNDHAEEHADNSDYCKRHHYLLGPDAQRWNDNKQTAWRRAVAALLTDLLAEVRSLNETMTNMAVEQIKDNINQ